MTEENKEKIRNSLINVHKENSTASSIVYSMNRENFLFWLNCELEQKFDDFIRNLEPGLRSIKSGAYIFAYALENPVYFAEAMIRTLEAREGA